VGEKCFWATVSTPVVEGPHRKMLGGRQKLSGRIGTQRAEPENLLRIVPAKSNGCAVAKDGIGPSTCGTNSGWREAGGNLGGNWTKVSTGVTTLKFRFWVAKVARWAGAYGHPERV